MVSLQTRVSSKATHFDLGTTRCRPVTRGTGRRGLMTHTADHSTKQHTTLSISCMTLLHPGSSPALQPPTARRARTHAPSPRVRVRCELWLTRPLAPSVLSHSRSTTVPVRDGAATGAGGGRHIHWERVYLPIVNMTEFNVLARHGEEEQYVLTI